MLHPGAMNLHDWAEVYFEGVGWVPVDASFGRYTPAGEENLIKFYSTGLDQWRLAANKGVCGEFFPAKTFIRSETVDSQTGEVECSKGNLFYPGWDQELEILSVEDLGNGIVPPSAIIRGVKQQVAPARRQVIFELKGAKEGDGVGGTG